ncbi:archaellin/type IV pilin N-terminal domain-containing protein [Natronosalvus caseinilyticus]|uniref:archaellin/type IV pilin N-terminal domain-containing protein n=1 Tax=Natronosalvus caseinilyticus TaxID=2953747 RepID=UPI0028A7F13F|nr:archaellin/type IV pilin N-terminal domain-containing protein [Natronosalvus caseinilyticus]
MFEQITDTDERGQVGIGTLIVFIAMVLVAAIAAGVLINTAGSLQSQASDTGTETQQAVANQVEVVHAYAENTTETVDGFDNLNLIVKKSAGSDVIDMESLTVQYTSESGSHTLAHVDTDNTGPYFTTTDATGAGDDMSSLTDSSDRINVNIDFGLDENPMAALQPGDSATVELVDQSGAKYSYGVTMPQTVSDDQTVANV